MDPLDQRIQEILKAEAEAILAVKITPDYQQALHLLNNCPGKIVTTGIGKAGFIARKFAATLCSTATPAVFIHPGESVHGDLGLIEPPDCLVAFSTSGKSREVIEMLKLSRQLGLQTIVGITSHPDSELRTLCDLILDMGLIKEPCYLGLTPTASSAVMLAISDVLALLLMEIKGVSRYDYGLRHHGGYLGEQSHHESS